MFYVKNTVLLSNDELKWTPEGMIYIHSCIRGVYEKEILKKSMCTGKTVEGCCFNFRSEEFMNPELIFFYQIDVY